MPASPGWVSITFKCRDPGEDAGYFSYFTLCYNRIPNRRNFRKEGFILACIMVRKTYHGKNMRLLVTFRLQLGSRK